jgi:5-methyltetrahydropteroyltriglutamate--homocysteine methyltransferase
LTKGVNRDIKKAVEAYWAGKLTPIEMERIGVEVRKWNWTSIQSKGVDIIPRFAIVAHIHPPLRSIAKPSLTQLPYLICDAIWYDIGGDGYSGDFTYYDHVLDQSIAFNVIPARYQGHALSQLDIMFAMGRGRQAAGVDVPASEMKKWLTTILSLSLSLSPLIRQSAILLHLAYC